MNAAMGKPAMGDATTRRVPPTGNIAVLARQLEAAGASCELHLSDGRFVSIGAEPPTFKLIFRTRAALKAVDEYSLGRAYISGELDFEGDVMALLDARGQLRRGMAPWQWLLFAVLFVSPPAWTSTLTIRRHYTLGDDFYLSFLDRRYRFYSQCIFESPDDELEEAAERKLERMWGAIAPPHGSRLLDIGGGWGGLTEYSAPRGVNVTSLTLAEDSADYIRRLIAEKALRGDVVVEDFLDHCPAVPYDNAVIFGVIEHIPNYRLFCRRLWGSVKPGGRLYLDASASRLKYAISPFSRRFIWPGTHTFLALQDMVQELLFHGFDVIEVRRETRDYELTIGEWARRLDIARDEICDRFGESIYRLFRVYLWGGAHAFSTSRLQAYHLVAERRDDPGPRPGWPRRLGAFVASWR
jgi:cyclopropane-fatty-acyl-phospholipid synthase